MNAIDKGHRRCILVTNNEVAAGEAQSLSLQGFQPGQDEWERHGICRSVTWPRTKFTVLGHRDDGTGLVDEYITGQTREVQRARRFRHIGFVDARRLDTSAKRKQLVALIDGLPQTLATGDEAFIVSVEHSVSVLFDETQADAWLEALDGQDHITDLVIVAPSKCRFDQIKTEVNDLLGPAMVSEEVKRPMSEGFAANVEYFRLDFLDPEQVALKRQFREVLPLLWMRAGCQGPRPGCPPARRCHPGWRPRPTASRYCWTRCGSANSCPWSMPGPTSLTSSWSPIPKRPSRRCPPNCPMARCRYNCIGTIWRTS